MGDLCPIDILVGEIAVEVTGVVGVSPALWYFRYIAGIFLTLHKRLCFVRKHIDIPSCDECGTMELFKKRLKIY